MQNGHFERGVRTVVIVDLPGYWRVRLELGSFIPVALAWRLCGISKAEAYRRFESGRWTQVFAFGECSVLERDLETDGLLHRPVSSSSLSSSS